MARMGLALALMGALTVWGAAQAAEPVKVGDFGAWELLCDNDINTGCTAIRSVPFGQGEVSVLAPAKAPRRLGVIAEGRNYVVTGLVDGGTPFAGQCEGDICLFMDTAFEAMWARGNVLTVRVAAPGAQPFSFDSDLPSLRQALAAATDWLKRNPRR